MSPTHLLDEDVYAVIIFQLQLVARLVVGAGLDTVAVRSHETQRRDVHALLASVGFENLSEPVRQRKARTNNHLSRQ